jgi:hypothetical protein
MYCIEANSTILSAGIVCHDMTFAKDSHKAGVHMRGAKQWTRGFIVTQDKKT